VLLFREANFKGTKMGIQGKIVDGTASAENLYGTRADDIISGEAGGDFLRDGMGDDFVYGGDGDDLVYADLGDDFYFGGSGNDQISFQFIDVQSNTEYDQNTLGVRFDLSRIGAQNLGYLGRDSFYSFEHVAGSYGDDTLFGNAGANAINGLVGNDRIDGRAGADIIAGSDGADRMTGGMGADNIDCGNLGNDGARDLVVFKSITESGVTSNSADHIAYFTNGSAPSADRLDLSAIDADPFTKGNQKFSFIGKNDFSSDNVGEIRFAVVGADIRVSVDTDHDNGAEMTFYLTNVAKLTAVDFIL
jgi:hypothetical protein